MADLVVPSFHGKTIGKDIPVWASIASVGWERVNRKDPTAAKRLT